jgi:hypothetical protein
VIRLHGFPRLEGPRGRIVLVVPLAINALLAFYSSAAGLSDAIAFVRKSQSKLPKVTGTAGSIFSVLPALQQFGYFAPQVCSEFRLRVRLGDSSTGQVKDVEFSLSSEAELLLSSLNASAQEERPAKALSAAYASYALDQERSYDFARVYVQAENLPPLERATEFKRKWVTIRGYYFMR